MAASWLGMTWRDALWILQFCWNVSRAISQWNRSSKPGLRSKSWSFKNYNTAYANASSVLRRRRDSQDPPAKSFPRWVIFRRKNEIVYHFWADPRRLVSHIFWKEGLTYFLFFANRFCQTFVICAVKSNTNQIQRVSNSCAVFKEIVLFNYVWKMNPVLSVD